MQYSALNGLMIPKLTLGTASLGLDYGIANSGKPSSVQSFNVLSAAVKEGINCIDTAQDYGNAEALIGEFAEKENSSQALNIVTKFKLKVENISNKKKARNDAYESILSSRRLLKISKIPVCLFHKPADVPVAQVLDVVLPIFEELKRDGLINIAGISAYYPSELTHYATHDILQAFQVPMNVFDMRLINTGVLPELKAAGKMIFIRSVFLQGLFFMKTAALKGNLVKAEKYLNALNELAAENKMSVAQLAFSYVSSTEGITSVVFGAVMEEQVQQNAAMVSGPVLNTETRKIIEKIFADVPEDILIPGVWTA